MRAPAEARMVDEADPRRAELFAKRFVHWADALAWIAEVEGCSKLDAFFKLGNEISCKDIRAVDGNGDPVPPQGIHDRLTEEFDDVRRKINDHDFLSYAKKWQRPELVTYINLEDLRKRWPSIKQSISSTAGAETKAIEFLTSQLKADPHLGRKRALKICREQVLNLSERGFLARVWPKAREAAGLDPIASRGRKPKQKPQIP